MTWPLHLEGVFDQRTERRRGGARDALWKPKQFVDAIERSAWERSAAGGCGAHRVAIDVGALEQLAFRSSRPAPRVVAPRLHERTGDHPVADDVDAERSREHLFAPLPAEVPVVGDIVVV